MIPSNLIKNALSGDGMGTTASNERGERKKNNEVEKGKKTQDE